MVDVLIARHGQSEWNAQGRWQGQADPPLSPLGELQAAHAASRLSGIDVVVASDLERARRTACIIAESLGVDDVRTDPAFRERHAGEWQGLTREEIERQWPGYLADRRRPPGFESDEALLARTDAGLRRIVDDHTGRRVLVVSHGGVIYRWEEVLGAAVERIPNLGGRWFHLRPTGSASPPERHDGVADHVALGRFALGDRVVLVRDDEVTVPSQL
jgi:probable phosphoglycerate mutase